MSIGIATWNILADHHIQPDLYPRSPVHILRPGARRWPIAERVHRLARSPEIDFVFLQEVDGYMARQFTDMATSNRWTVYYAPTRSDGAEGCLVLACGGWRVHEIEVLPYQSAAGNNAQHLLVGRGPDRSIDLYHTHIRWGSEETFILQRQVTELIGWAGEQTRPTVILGDLNITPTTTMLADLVNSGFDDTHRNEDVCSALLFNATRLRLDYILTRAMSGVPIVLGDNAIDDGQPIPTPTNPSDHLPIAATLSALR